MESYDDPTYQLESENDSCEDISSSFMEEDSNNRFNPFDSNSDEQANSSDKAALNSSVSFNPFDSDSDSGESAEKKLKAKSYLCHSYSFSFLY